MPFTYEYARPALTVDCVLFACADELRVLLIRRDLPPFKGMWALPGGFVHLDETVDAAARRELAEETGVRDVYLEQLATFGDVERDPRERVVTVAHYALVDLEAHPLRAATDAAAAAWFPVADPPRLAFDHAKILDAAVGRLKEKVRREPVGFELLPERFTLTRLQKLYEAILERALDKRNFRKKILAMDLIEETDQVEEDVAHRAARLYRFDRAKYEKLKLKGFDFEV